MKLLAIETSCDETGVAIVAGERTEQGFSFNVLGDALFSQAKLHAEYGGVYPNLAKREHLKNLPIILEQAIAKAGLKNFEEIDAITVTEGPGLEPALWTGITFAQQISQEQKLPLFGINHMEGHLLSSLVQEGKLEKINFPVLALLVSGGHTEFVVMREWFVYEKIGETLDDAVGECFDKVARMLGLPYPGGPEISKLAKIARDSSVPESRAKLPRPMLQKNNCDVSFSGLKTAALYALRDMGGIQKLSSDEILAFTREFEDAVADVFVHKTRRALTQNSAKIFVIGGGVAANSHLRTSLAQMISEEFLETEIRLPELSITGDNAVMIAEAALMHLLADDWHLNDPQKEIRAQGNLSIVQK